MIHNNAYLIFSANFPPNISGSDTIVVTMNADAIIHATAFDLNNDTFTMKAYGLPKDAFVIYGNDYVTAKWQLTSLQKVSF